MRQRIACSPVSHVVAPVVLLVSLLGAAASAQQGPAFEGRYFATSNFPQRIACGDFTGDGRPDVASADGNGSLVALSVGNGAGGFAPAAILSVSNSSPVAMELVDIDGNGSLDLVLAYTKSIIAPPFTNFNYVEIRLNNGAGVFAAASILNLANFTGASGIAVGDLNGDGLPDIAVSQSGVNTLSLLLGSAPGAFALPSNYSVGFPTADVSIGDANHDGLGDLAAASLQPNQIVAFALGTSGGPGIPTNLPMGATLSQVSLVDVSGDGRLDIVAAGLSAPGFLTRLGDGLGAFGALAYNAIPNTIQQMTFGDWNGDGVNDAAAITFDPIYSLSVRNSSPNVPFAFGLDSTIGGIPNYLAAADFDGDGRLDLVTGQVMAKGIALWRGDGLGGFGTAPSLQLQDKAGAPVLVSDLNHDGDVDLVTVENPQALFSVRLAVPTPAGAPTAHLSPTNYPLSQPGAAAPVLGDVNGDGFDDFVAYHSYPFCFDAILNNGSGGFGAPNVTQTPSLSPYGLALADMNLDGALDAVLTQIQLPDPQSNNRRVAIYLGNGAGGFAFSGARTIVGIPDGVSILDANSDGKPDAVTHHSTTIVTLCFGDGAGGFASSSDTNTGVASYFVPVGDMNGDSLLDVVVSGIGAHVWLSNGAGALAQAGGFNTISFGPPLLADLDGDADLDLAATDYATDRLLIASGDGAGGLASPLSVVTGHGPTGVALRDTNKDGRLDAAAATAGSNGYWNVIVFHENTGSLSGITNYGAGVPGCLGAHAIGVNALPHLGDANFAFTCTNAPQASLGLVLLASTADPAGPDLFHLGIPIFVSTLSPVFLGLDAHSFGSGFGVAPAPIPNIPLLAGSQFSAQALWVWPPFLCQPSPFHLSSSGGLTITLH